MPCCGNCFEPVTSQRNLVETRDGRWICVQCAKKLGLCEICGSTKLPGQSDSDQLHYEEECFK